MHRRDERTADQHRHPHTAGSGADVWWLVLAAVGLVGLAALTVAIANHVVFGFDQPLLALGQSWDGWPDLWKAISETANIPLIVIGLGFVIWLFVTKRRRDVRCASTSSASSRSDLSRRGGERCERRSATVAVAAHDPCGG